MQTEEKILAALLRIEELLIQHQALPQGGRIVAQRAKRAIAPSAALSFTKGEEDLVTTKFAMVELGVSRWKINQMRKCNELTTLKKGTQVRLLRREVEAAKGWYGGR